MDAHDSMWLSANMTRSPATCGGPEKDVTPMSAGGGKVQGRMSYPGTGNTGRVSIWTSLSARAWALVGACPHSPHMANDGHRRTLQCLSVALGSRPAQHPARSEVSQEVEQLLQEEAPPHTWASAAGSSSCGAAEHSWTELVFQDSVLGTGRVCLTA